MTCYITCYCIIASFEIIAYSLMPHVVARAALLLVYFMCVYIYIYIYICILVYYLSLSLSIHTYIYIYISLYIYIYIHTYMTQLVRRGLASGRVGGNGRVGELPVRGPDVCGVLPDIIIRCLYMYVGCL